MTRSRNISYATLAAFACTATAFGQGALTPAPMPLPPAPVVAPAAPTPPASVASAAAPATASQKVLIIPFAAYNVPDNEQWIPKAVQEDLVAALGATRALSPVAFQGQVIVEDNATAARLAKNASASYAVRGAAQVIEGTIRITAQLIDASTGDTVNSASVTGPINNLLAMEDNLSAQLLGLPATAAAAPTTVGQTPVAPPPAAPQVATVPAAPQAPQIIVVPQPQPVYAPAYNPYPAYSDYYPYDSYYSAYPYYYGGYYSPIWFGTFISGNRFDHGHDHDHDHDGHFGGGGFDGGHGGFDGGHGGGGHTGPRIVSSGGNSATSLPIPTSGAPLPLQRGSLSLPVPQRSAGISAPVSRSFSSPPMGGGMMHGGDGFRR